MNIITESLSWSTIKVHIRFDEQEIGIATAFLYTHKEKRYLLTNWHVVTGREPDTLNLKSKMAAIPNNLLLKLAVTEKNTSKIAHGEVEVGWRGYILNLYDKDIPIWYEHPEFNCQLDAVAIPFDVENTVTIPINDPVHCYEKIQLKPSMDVFTLGYPIGITGSSSFPVWKKGSIATEPHLDIEQQPKLYIDTATREGMSGAPVIAQKNGYFVPEGNKKSDWIIGQGRKFLGMYSGRIGSDTFLAQLGIVWKESALIEIIEAQKIGKSSFKLIPM